MKKSPLLIFLVAGIFIIVGGISLFELNSNDQTTMKDEPSYKRKIVVTVEQSKSDLILPVIVTESIISDKPFEKIDYREIIFDTDITSLNGQLDMNEKNNSLQITDSQGNNIMKKENYSKGILFEKVEKTVKATCNETQTRINFAQVMYLPLEEPNTEIYIQHPAFGVSPELDNTYHLKFSSFFETNIILPKNATILSEQIEKCTIENEEHSEIFVFDTIFVI